MNRLLVIILLLLSSLITNAQSAYLFLKKGFHKKRTYMEGSTLVLKLQNNFIIKGTITLLRNDTIFLNGRAVPIPTVKAVIVTEKIKKTFHTNAAEILLITGGAALTTTGLTVSKQADFGQALTAGLVIGYGPLLIRYLGSKISLNRKKFIIGKKFHLQILDFYLSPQRPF
jgi:hypothetical protein